MAETEESQDAFVEEKEDETMDEAPLVTTSLEMLQIKLGIKDGDRFSTFKEFDKKLQESLKKNYLRYSKRDSRTIEGAKRKLRSRIIRPELEYYQLRYACFFAHKNRPPRSTARRVRKSLSHQVPHSCPAGLALRVTEDGEFLEVYNVSELHNHPVNEQDYLKLIPKRQKATTIDIDDDIDLNSLAEMDKDTKFKYVLKRCRYIARIASISNSKRLQQIMKNLDDFTYYLKYTTSPEDMQIIEKEDQAILEKSNNNLELAEFDPEQIRIVVQESDEEPMDA